MEGTYWHVNPQTSPFLRDLFRAVFIGLHHRAAHLVDIPALLKISLSNSKGSAIAFNASVEMQNVQPIHLSRVVSVQKCCLTTMKLPLLTRK